MKIQFYITISFLLTSLSLKAQKNVDFSTLNQNKTWAIGIYGGTLGPGLSLSKSINPAFTIRLGGTYLPIKIRDNGFVEETRTDVDLTLLTIDAKLDYYISKNPKNPFHIILGGTYNGSKIKTFSTPLLKRNITLGNQVLTEEEIGTATMEIRPNKFNLFLGAGVGRLVHPKRKIGVKFELGGLFTGSPKTSLEATGMIAPTANQESQLQRNLRQYYIYPVVNFYLSYKL